MISCTYNDFHGIKQELRHLLAREGKSVDVGEWQSIRRSERDLPQQKTIELQNAVFELNVPPTMKDLQLMIRPNLPFAEAQFQDRVSGEPLNPPPSDKLWPWAHHLEDDKPEGKYSHTYPERYWPKQAGEVFIGDRDLAAESRTNVGLRYEYGDLHDVVSLLARSPHTRQAYLPVWFPEDTGAVHGERVPCSLGYHFLLRRGQLDCTYFIRSVDFFRHFPDDVYMTCRLMQWIVDQLGFQSATWVRDLTPGSLVMHMCSLHIFEAERNRLRKTA